MSDYLASIEIENGMDLFREAYREYKNDNQDTLARALLRAEHVLLLSEFSKRKKEAADKVLGSKGKIIKLCQGAESCVCGLRSSSRTSTQSR